MTTIHVGIDPGVAGAIAFYQLLPSNPNNPTGGNLVFHSVYDLPVIAKTLASGATRKRLDVVELHKLLASWPAIASITIEDVHALPGEGAVQAFSFGHVVGSIFSVSRLCCEHVNLVTPQAWKAAYGLSADKNESRFLAEKLTGTAEPFARKKDDGRAEAALLAHYGASAGNVERQGATLEAYRSTEAAKPKKIRKRKDEVIKTGTEVLEELRARAAQKAM